MAGTRVSTTLHDKLHGSNAVPMTVDVADRFTVPEA